MLTFNILIYFVNIAIDLCDQRQKIFQKFPKFIEMFTDCRVIYKPHQHVTTRMYAQGVLGLVQQFSTAITAELTTDSGSSIAPISAKVDSGVLSLSINFPMIHN